MSLSRSLSSIVWIHPKWDGFVVVVIYGFHGSERYTWLYCCTWMTLVRSSHPTTVTLTLYEMTVTSVVCFILVHFLFLKVWWLIALILFCSISTVIALYLLYTINFWSLSWAINYVHIKWCFVFKQFFLNIVYDINSGYCCWMLQCIGVRCLLLDVYVLHFWFYFRSLFLFFQFPE